MAFNWQTFRTRTISAAVFVVVMLAGLLGNDWMFFILISILHLGCWLEYQRLVGKIDEGYSQITPFHRYGVIIAGWSISLWFTDSNFNIGSIPLHSIGWNLGLVLAFALPIIEILFTRQMSMKNIGHSAFGLLYISLSWGLMLDLRLKFQFEEPHEFWNKLIPLVLVLSIWINDTMAYIVGSLIGKTPFSSISPKKTWEGTLGGILLAVVVMTLVGYLTGAFKLIDWLCISAIASITGTVGDLLESKLKRLANVKDSGQMMPGHGGFLDRFDSLLVATPFVWLYVHFFM